MEDRQKDLQTKLAAIVAKANVPGKKALLSTLESQTYEPTFWSDSQAAAEVMKQITALKKEIDDVEMMQLLMEENQLDEAEKLLYVYEILMFLSGPHDRGDTIFAIHAGQGGTEAMDWAEILKRM